MAEPGVMMASNSLSAVDVLIIEVRAVRTGGLFRLREVGSPT